MKKIIFSLSIIAASIIGTANAQSKIPAAATVSLEQHFNGVTHASWSQVSDLYKADFNYQDNLVSAYFNADGDLVATGRKLDKNELPLSLQIEINKKYAGFAVISLMEITMYNSPDYYINIESSSKKITLKASVDGGVEVYKKEQLPLI